MAGSDGPARDASAAPLSAGRIGRPHGLDGSFWVDEPLAELLAVGRGVLVAGTELTIERRAGTDAKPLVRLSGLTRREDLKAVRGAELLVPAAEAAPLADDEFYAHELEGSRVLDGDVEVGVVRRLIPLPSCDALEVDRGQRPALLVPLVRDAVRSIDPAARRIDVDLAFLGEEA